jgi:hypothetical protein
MSVDPIDLELMQRKADALGYYVNEHKVFDPCRGNGSLYVQDKRKSRGQSVTSHLRYATPEMVWDLLNLAEQAGRK